RLGHHACLGGRPGPETGGCREGRHQVHRGDDRQAVRESAMNHFSIVTGVVLALCAGLVCGAEDKPLTPVEARKKVGAKITVEMTVRAAKDRLDKRGEIYLDSETDFRDPKNFAVVITQAGAASLRKAGIDDPADHYEGKKIRATGTVKEVDQV